MKRNKGGKYADRTAEYKRKVSKRAVISYEDMPLEEYDDERTKISKRAVKRILICTAVIIVFGLIVFAVANRDSLTPERISRFITYDVLGSRDTGFPVELSGSEVKEGNFLYDGDISYVSDTTYVGLNSRGNEIAYSPITFANSVLKSKGDKVLIYNLGGGGYVTGDKKQLNKTRELKTDIFTGDIARNGKYCLVTKADGYLSKLTVYDADNQKVFAYSFADYYITAVALNEDGSGCVACGLTGKEGSLSSICYVLNFLKKEPVSTYSLDDNNIYAIKYLNSNIACMVGSNSSYTLHINKGQLNQLDYNQMQLTAFDINEDTDTFVLSLSRSGDGRKCSIEYVDRDAQVISVNDTNRAVESISLYKDRVAVLDNNVCYLYDTQGNGLGKADTGNGSLKIVLESADSGYVLGMNELRAIREFKSDT